MGELPRPHRDILFYYDLRDRLDALQRGKPWKWAEVRVDVVVWKHGKSTLILEQTSANNFLRLVSYHIAVPTTWPGILLIISHSLRLPKGQAQKFTTLHTLIAGFDFPTMQVRISLQSSAFTCRSIQTKRAIQSSTILPTQQKDMVWPTAGQKFVSISA